MATFVGTYPDDPMTAPQIPKRIIGARALTVRQPWASLIIEGRKTIENRSKPTKHRGLLVIHAGLRTKHDALDKYRRLLKNADDLPSGAILGTVDVVDCIEGARSRWAEPGYYHWVAGRPATLPQADTHEGCSDLCRVEG
jgi:hypothetical protein